MLLGGGHRPRVRGLPKQPSERLEAEALASEGALRARLDQLAGRGVVELEALLDSPDTPTRLRAKIAMDVLDRGGFTAPDRHEVTFDYASAIQQAYERYQARKRAQGGAALPHLEALPAPEGPSSESTAVERQG